MKVCEFYESVQRRADTPGQSINAAEVSRVLATAAIELGRLPPDEAFRLVGEWIRAAEED